jgi:hypothetical protein
MKTLKFFKLFENFIILKFFENFEILKFVENFRVLIYDTISGAQLYI